MQFTQAVLLAVLAITTTTIAQTLNIPASKGKVTLKAPQTISGYKDMGNKEYGRGVKCSDGDTGSSHAVFILESGATLANVIIGADQLEGVHCKGACTLINVWFRDVCEDAITILGSGDARIQGGGAQNAADKVVQHNGLSGTVTIKGFTGVNIGKLYRGCGNCSKNGGPRKVVVSGCKIKSCSSDLVGINNNYGDTAALSNNCGVGVKSVCQQYTGVLKSAGKESAKNSGKTNCLGAQGKLTTLPSC